MIKAMIKINLLIKIPMISKKIILKITKMIMSNQMTTIKATKMMITLTSRIIARQWMMINNLTTIPPHKTIMTSKQMITVLK